MGSEKNKTTAMACYSALTHTRHHTRRVPGTPGSTERCFVSTVVVVGYHAHACAYKGVGQTSEKPATLSQCQRSTNPRRGKAIGHKWGRGMAAVNFRPPQRLSPRANVNVNGFNR